MYEAIWLPHPRKSVDFIELFLIFQARYSATTYCDGYNWNSSVPDCVRSNSKPLTKCNFNHGDLCGWSQLQVTENRLVRYIIHQIL